MKKIMILILTTIIVIFSSIAVFGRSEKSFENKNEVYYDLVEVSKGDTIWSIASEYSNENITTKQYVDCIIEFNNMKNCNIYPGENIVVPVYDI